MWLVLPKGSGFAHTVKEPADAEIQLQVISDNGISFPFEACLIGLFVVRGLVQDFLHLLLFHSAVSYWP